MRVREWMSPHLITAAPTTPVAEAREVMRRKRIRHLVVMEGEHLAGIITDRDIRLNLPSPASSLSVWEVNYLLAKLTVGRAMSRSVITIDPDRPIAEAVDLMLEHKIGALPVTEGTRVVGIITETDLLRAFARMLSTREEAESVSGYP